jgi:hypothetical protein
MKTIYDLKLHESLRINSHIEAHRVPNGWNYIYSYSSGIVIVLVPYSNEFKELKP